MYNILTDDIIRFGAGGEIKPASLPETYAALMRDEVESFPSLRPHQRHAWHAFTVQLGAMALHRAELVEPPTDAETWREIIRGLTPDFPDDEPWRLVVDDITKPAFMQPPATSEKKIADYKSVVGTPDELDMLATSKNHDLKISVASPGETEDWLFALLTLQTMDGYLGSRNYGISRMPSGYGNRPAFSVTPSIRLGAHIRRDLKALPEYRQEVLDAYSMADSGIGLVWTLPWDGEKSEALSLSQMDPFYIEICRRIRLRNTAGRVHAVRATSLFRRIVDCKGLTGDPWAPTGTPANRKSTPPAFLNGVRKFGYERVVDGLFSPDWERPRLLNTTRHDLISDSRMTLVARGVVRGEGGTQGYHERVVPIKEKVIRAFGAPAQLKEIGDIARERIEQVANVQRILWRAIYTFVNWGEAPGPKPVKAKSDIARRWTDRLGEIVDVSFFDDLQAEYDEDDESERSNIRNGWLMNGEDGVVDHALDILRQAEDSIPCPATHRYKARVRADSEFHRNLRGTNGLPFLFTETHDGGEKCQKSDQTTQPQTPQQGGQIPMFA